MFLVIVKVANSNFPHLRLQKFFFCVVGHNDKLDSSIIKFLMDSKDTVIITGIGKTVEGEEFVNYVQSKGKIKVSVNISNVYCNVRILFLPSSV